jgi:hypothetical protein
MIALNITTASQGLHPAFDFYSSGDLRLKPCRFHVASEGFPRNKSIDLNQRVVLSVQISISVRDVEKIHLPHIIFSDQGIMIT